MYKGRGKTADHHLLHCEIASTLWKDVSVLLGDWVRCLDGWYTNQHARKNIRELPHGYLLENYSNLFNVVHTERKV